MPFGYVDWPKNVEERTPISEIKENGVKFQDGKENEYDAIIKVWVYILQKIYLLKKFSVRDIYINSTFCQKNFQNLVAIFWSQTAFTNNVFRWKMKNYGLSECKIWSTQLLCFSFRKFCKNKFFKFDLIIFENFFMKFRDIF